MSLKLLYKCIEWDFLDMDNALISDVNEGDVDAGLIKMCDGHRKAIFVNSIYLSKYCNLNKSGDRFFNDSALGGWGKGRNVHKSICLLSHGDKF